MKRKLLTVILAIIATVSLAMATFSFTFADTAEPVYSYNLAINGDFEESDPVGATAKFAEKYGATHYFGNFFSGYNLAAGLFNTNQRVMPDNTNVTLVEGAGVNGSNAVKVVYNGITDGFAYRVAQNQMPSVLAQPGKNYKVAVQHKMDFETDNVTTFCGPQITLSFWINNGATEGNPWVAKTYVIHSISWAHEANTWETIGGIFKYDLTEEGGVKTCTVTYTSDNNGTIATDSFTYSDLFYIDVILASSVAGGVPNEVYYDNFVIEECYDAKVQVTDPNAEPITNLQDKFTVNGVAVTPTYDNGMYVFNNLTGENEIKVVDQSLNLVTSSAKVYGDKSVLTEITGDGFWASYAANTEPRSILFGTPRYQDITLNIKDNANNAISGAVVSGDYTVEEVGNGVYTVKDVMQTATEFTLSIKAAGCYPATVTLDGSVASKDATLRAVVDKSENLIVNGDFENSDNFVAYDATDVDEKWRPANDKAAISLGDEIFAGVKSLKVDFTQSATGVAYRIPTDTIANDTWYSFGARTKIETASKNNDAVYTGITPVVKLNDGTTFSYDPTYDLMAFVDNCKLAESFPIANWVNLSGIIRVNFNEETDTVSLLINGKETVIANVDEVIGYDIYFVYTNGDNQDEFSVFLDRVTFGVAAGYTGLDLGNDSSNIFANGDFENASTIKDNYLTFGFWTTSSARGHVEQNGDYSKNGMSSMKAEMDTDTFLSVRTELFNGRNFSSVTLGDFKNLKPGVFHTIKGYVKSESVGATLSLNFMPTLFKGGLAGDAGATGGYMPQQMTSYTFTASDSLDGEWIEMSATLYYTVDFATGTISAWFNKTDVSGTPDFTYADIYEFHALDITFSVDADAVIYFDLWTLYAAYDATVTVLGEDGNATTDKTLVLKDFFGNDVTANYSIVAENGVYKINGAYGPLTVSISGDDTYPAQTLSSTRTERTLQKPYSYTVTVKGADGEVMGKDDIQVSVKKEGADTGVITWNDDGSFTISGLTGNNITVTVMAEGYKNGNITISGAGSQELNMQLDVKPAFNAIVTVKDGENNPINNAKVEIKRGDVVLATATSGRNGTYTLTGLNDDVEGALVVVVTLDGYSFETGKTITRGAATVQIKGTKTGGDKTDNGKSGCGSAIGSVSLIASTFALVGAAFVTTKKKKGNR